MNFFGIPANIMSSTALVLNIFVSSISFTNYARAGHFRSRLLLPFLITSIPAAFIGVFVGITAFFSGFMNWNFIMSGSASVNGVFFGLAVLLVMAWKVAGYIGIDYYLLPRLAPLWSRKQQKNKS